MADTHATENVTGASVTEGKTTSGDNETTHLLSSSEKQTRARLRKHTRWTCVAVFLPMAILGCVFLAVVVPVSHVMPDAEAEADATRLKQQQRQRHSVVNGSGDVTNVHNHSARSFDEIK